jgi:hypothetical protein
MIGVSMLLSSHARLRKEHDLGVAGGVVVGRCGESIAAVEAMSSPYPYS